MAAQFFVAIAPPFTSDLGSAEDFFKSYLALPVVLLFWVIGYLWKREGFLRLDQIDLDTGRREHDWDTINAYRAKTKTWPWWRKMLSVLY